MIKAGIYPSDLCRRENDVGGGNEPIIDKNGVTVSESSTDRTLN